MKKIIIVMAIVALSLASNAAAFSWKTSATGKVYQPGTTTLVSGSYMAYLFDSSSVTQAALVSAFNARTLDLSTYSSISRSTLNNGVIAKTEFSDGTAVGSTLTGFFALIVGEKLFISDMESANGYEGKVSSIAFSARAASQAAEMLASNGYQGAGWYAVPEPTSGLLLLLGMAGLALRRKQA